MVRGILLVAAIASVPIARSAALPSVAAGAKVVAFYRWYLRHIDDRLWPLDQPPTRAFLTNAYRLKLEGDHRSGSSAEGLDPFIQVQDFDDADWNANVVAERTTGFPVDPRVVVRLGTGRDVARFCVHLRWEDQSWKISKVDAADDRDAPTDCRTEITDPHFTWQPRN